MNKRIVKITWIAVLFITGLVGFVAAIPILLKDGMPGQAEAALFALMLIVGGTGFTFSLLMLTIRGRSAQSIGFWELVRMKTPEDSHLRARVVWARVATLFWLLGAVGVLLLIILSPKASCC